MTNKYIYKLMGFWLIVGTLSALSLTSTVLKKEIPLISACIFLFAFFNAKSCAQILDIPEELRLSELEK